MGEAEFREAVGACLNDLAAPVEHALRRELADPIDPDHGRRLQFEVCPHFFGIKLVQTENDILEDYVIHDRLGQQVWDASAAADFDLHALVGNELFSWFADRWAAVSGPQQYHPAYIYYHDEDDVRWDLEQRRWLSVQGVWPEGPWL